MSSLQRIKRIFDTRWERRVSERLYHSFPDPEEKPKISYSSSSRKSKIKKKAYSFIDDTEKKHDDNTTSVNFYSNPSSNKNQFGNHEEFTDISKLSNGLSVASQDMHGLMSSFAFAVGSGSSSENPSIECGASQMLELTAWNGTKSRTHEDIISEMEKMGGMVQCISGRESILYCVDVLKVNLDPAMELLSDIILNSEITNDIIEENKLVMQYQWNELSADIISRDVLTMAAYNNSPLGQHHYFPIDSNTGANMDHLCKDVIDKFRLNNFYAENCFLCGAGVNHDDFVNLADKHFKSLKSSSMLGINTNSNKVNKNVYKGGLLMSQRELREPFVKVAVGFEVGGWHTHEMVAACVLQQLLGGGSSFSAGGPGKGMYTRLYLELLNRHYWVEGVESFVLLFNEVGLFGIDGACKAADVPKLLHVIIDQFVKLAYINVTDEELDRAKNMLKSLMLMQLESRLVVCEDITRQIMTLGSRETSKSLVQQINSVSKEDLRKVAHKMIQYDPSIAVVGHDVSHVAQYEKIRDYIKDYAKVVEQHAE